MNVLGENEEVEPVKHEISSTSQHFNNFSKQLHGISLSPFACITAKWTSTKIFLALWQTTSRIFWQILIASFHFIALYGQSSSARQRWQAFHSKLRVPCLVHKLHTQGGTFATEVDLSFPHIHILDKNIQVTQESLYWTYTHSPNTILELAQYDTHAPQNSNLIFDSTSWYYHYYLQPLHDMGEKNNDVTVEKLCSMSEYY